MNQDSYLIVGLGNPGARFANTWHNIGADIVSMLAERWSLKLKPEKSNCVSAEGVYFGAKCYLLIPTNYMNRSGEAVSAFIRYFSLNPANLIVIYDDHDLPLGKIRLREVGTSGGHRGVDDVILRLNTKNFKRLKVGTLVNIERRDLSHQVLTRIPILYRKDVDIVLEHSADAIEMSIERDFSRAMNHYNGLELFS